ncbi:hypothetical protein Tco_1486251 [Tanacetum coccineum]
MSDVTSLVRESTFGFKPGINNNRNIKSRYDVENLSPQSTPQVLPSIEENTPPVTYPKDIEETLGTPIEVEPLNETKLEEVGLNFNHNTPLSSREIPNFDGPEPQPLLNSPSLDVSIGDVIGPKPSIKPHSPDSSRMKEMFDDDWRLESKEVSPLGEELSLFNRPNEVDRGRILEAHRLEPILQQQNYQRVDPSHHGECGDGVTIYTGRRHHDTCDGVRIILTASNAQVIFDEKKLGSS